MPVPSPRSTHRRKRRFSQTQSVGWTSISPVVRRTSCRRCIPPAAPSGSRSGAGTQSKTRRSAPPPRRSGPGGRAPNAGSGPPLRSPAWPPALPHTGDARGPCCRWWPGSCGEIPAGRGRSVPPGSAPPTASLPRPTAGGPITDRERHP